MVGLEDVRMGGWEAGRMEGWEGVRQEKTKEEEGSSREGWREGEDKALYHNSLERVCLKQTPSRSPSPGRGMLIEVHGPLS